MGIYFNPGNEGFKRITNGKYVDKTAMIELVNRAIDTPDNLICVSRARRFGKSYAAQMLAAYYDRTCDSHLLFEGKDIAEFAGYEVNLNKYDIVYLDMTTIIGKMKNKSDFSSFVSDCILDDIYEYYPELVDRNDLQSSLLRIVKKIGQKLIFIIDEWDAPIREFPEYQDGYLNLLRALFKSSSFTNQVVAAAYMTGILPIRKTVTGSALSDFREYTMIAPGKFAGYFGFTEGEVEKLCTINDMDMSEMKRWYDGYHFEGVGSIYNPNSVMSAIEMRRYDSYWSKSTLSNELIDYIKKDYNGLAKDIAELVAGNSVRVDTTGFDNDLISFSSKDDVLTLLIHLGYLSYDYHTGTAYVPNEEIALEFSKAIRKVDHVETNRRVAECDKLFEETFNMNGEYVAKAIEKIHREETAPLHYNREASLRAIIKLAYYTYKDHYIQFEELPAGEGYADVVYIPKYDSGYPALLIELKWNKTADGAIAQIHDKHYPDAIKSIGVETILVGINYDADTKEHSCVIEKLVL